MKSPVVLAIAFFTALPAAHLQTNMDTDSLLRLLAISKPDSARVNLLIEIGQQLEGTNPSKAKEYYYASGNLSHQINYRLGILKFISNYTYILNIQGRFDSSLLMNRQSVQMAREWKDSTALAKCLFNTGTSYQLLGQYEAAAEAYLEGRNIFYRMHNQAFTAKADDILQTLYQKLKRYDKALILGQEAIEISRKLKLEYDLSTALANMASNYNAINQPQNALPLLQEALKLSIDTRNKYLEQAVQLSLAEARERMHQYARMKLPAERARSLARELADPEGETNALHLLSIYRFYSSDLMAADSLAREALVIARKNNLKEQARKVLLWLSDISLAEENLKEYQAYRTSADLIADSLLNNQIHRRIAELETKYETKLKESRISLLESQSSEQEMKLIRKSTFNVLLIGLITVLLATFLLLYRNFRQKQKLQQQRITELENEKQLLAAEAVLQGEEQERTRLAKDLHDGLGGMLSGIKFSFHKLHNRLPPETGLHPEFERSLDMLDSSIREIRRISHNLMPEALLSFGIDTALKDYCSEINQTGAIQVTYQSIGMAHSNLDRSTSIRIYRIAQELIGNILKHASANFALVQLIRDAGKISLTVEDDGRGFNTSALMVTPGMGWRNIRSRVEFLQGKIEMQSLPGEGTFIHIEFDVS